MKRKEESKIWRLTWGMKVSMKLGRSKWKTKINMRRWKISWRENRDGISSRSSHESLLRKNWRKKELSWGHEANRSGVETGTLAIIKRGPVIKEEASSWGTVVEIKYKSLARKDVAAKSEDSWWWEGGEKKNFIKEERRRESGDAEEEIAHSRNQRAVKKD